MKKVVIFVTFIIIFNILFLQSFTMVEAAVPAPGGGYWYRGSTHNHISRYSSDEYAFRDRYIGLGYDFLVWTEHDYDNPLPCSEQESLSTDGFLVLCGVEISTNNGHFGAIGIDNMVSASDSQDAVNKILNQNGVPIKHHPISDSFTATKFISTINLNHFEIANGNRLDQCDEAEMLWDSILSASNGRLVFAGGSDDNHGGTWGNGWVVVKANNLTKQEIRENFRQGNFYASTGVNLVDYQVDYNTKTITIETDRSCTITFISEQGMGNPLYEVTNTNYATYTASGSEKYVRVRAWVPPYPTSKPVAAWTQPVFFTGEPFPSPSSGTIPSPSASANPVLSPSPSSSIAPSSSPSPGTTSYDLNQDGSVDGKDVVELLSNWYSNIFGIGDYVKDNLINTLDFVTLIKYISSPLLHNFQTRISSSSDDAEQCISTTGVYLTSSDIEMVRDDNAGGGSDCTGDQIVGLRFINVTIPKGSTIQSAYIQFTVDEISTDPTNLTIWGEAIDNSPTFVSTANNISTRTKTLSFVSNWTPNPWNSTGQAGVDQQTPNLKTIIQEIIQRPNWNSGYPISIIIEGSGQRTAVSFNASSSKAPQLVVEYY